MTTESTATNPFEFWKEMTQNWTEAWTKNGGSWPNFDTANMFNQFQSFNPFLPNPLQHLDPYQVWQQVLRQYFDSWSEFWTKNLSGAASPEVFKEAQRKWMEQLETLGTSFSQAMSTEAYSSMLGKTIEQGLTLQDKFYQAVNPQTDAALKAFNLPSRSQMDRLFERVIGMEERLEELEEENRQLLEQLKDQDKTPAARGRARTTADADGAAA